MTNVNEMLEKAEGWVAIFNEDGHLDEDTRVTIREAFGTPDAPILFPKIISRTLKEAAEPVQLIVPMLDVVRLGKGRSLEFPAINAMAAAEIGEAQEYPEQALNTSKQVEGKVTKKGVKVVFTEEVISDSMWDIVGLHVRAAGRAMARLKEQIALGRFKDAATTVFDNADSPDVIANTTGRNINGAANLTLTWDDLIDMAAVLQAENKSPTDLILHPLMWPMFLKGAPFHVPTGENLPLGWNSSLKTREGAVNTAAPFGLNVMLSPYVNFVPKIGATPATSDVFLIDRNEIGSLLVKDDLSTDEWSDLTRDIHSLKMKERYDIICYGDGEGITVAKNVRLAQNYDVAVTRSITSDLT